MNCCGNRAIIEYSVSDILGITIFYMFHMLAETIIISTSVDHVFLKFTFIKQLFKHLFIQFDYSLSTCNWSLFEINC